MYTFVILTDPVPPPSSIPSRSSEGYSIGNASAALSGRSSFGTGGGIPGTGGMSLKGVLLQIYRGPWVDNVVKNPLLRALEREERIVEPNQDAADNPDATKINVIQESRLERTHGVDTDAFRESLEKGENTTQASNAQSSAHATDTSPCVPAILLPHHSLAAEQTFSTGIIMSPYLSRQTEKKSSRPRNHILHWSDSSTQ